MVKRLFSLLLFVVAALNVMAQPADYTWTTPSKNASESMPCGGGSIGMNVWVEDGDIWFYLSRSGAFDENNTLLKQGRVRIKLTPALECGETFRQTLRLNDGYVEITDGQKTVEIWADVFKPVVHVDVKAKGAVVMEATYENWRTKDIKIGKRERMQTSYKFAPPKGLVTRHDSIISNSADIVFLHHNGDSTNFDATIKQQQMDVLKDKLYNPIHRLAFGGRMTGTSLQYVGMNTGRYASTDFVGWTYKTTKKSSRQSLQIVLAEKQGAVEEWMTVLNETAAVVNKKKDQKASRQWWNEFWQRSYVISNDPDCRDITTNYNLFRYMLGCNAYGKWPTKFNGGLFTFDPEYVKVGEAEYQLSADFRNWGGGVHTAQNQRLVYWPMLKNGDADMMKPQLDFYLRILKNAEERSRLYWGHEGACYTEQIENYGLPNYAEYGKKRPADFDPGLEYNAWLEYCWDTILEFCEMAFEMNRYEGKDISEYIPMIESAVTFFDEHYQYLARRRGAKALDENGKLVMYPGSACETFKMAYNSTPTVTGLRVVTESLIDYLKDDTVAVARYKALLSRIPEMPTRIVEGKQVIAPAAMWERVNNVENPMLYPVFPWRIYGIERDNLQLALDTYWHDPYSKKFRSHIGWKQDCIWAACLGLTDEAARLAQLKLGNGPHRFPAFWGPGYDWTPDHNWGGSGMIGMQEMLMQEVDGRIILFPAWPKNWDVTFRLRASGNRVVEATMKDGKVENVRIEEFGGLKN